MSSINFNGTTNIGPNAHIGDNYYYTSAVDFYKSTPELQYTDTEKELVKIIFEKAPTEGERIQILDSLRDIKENSNKEEEQVKTEKSWHKLKEFGKSLLTDTAAKIIVELGSHYLSEIPFHQIFGQ